jgi:glutamate-1-semialdehyde 2,1-aminomutase
VPPTDERATVAARRTRHAGQGSTRSAELYERARQLLPGGVNSPVRAMRAIGRDPIFIASGRGSRITDVDGNQYIDWVSSWGPLILGHAHPDVLAAVHAAAADGTSFGAPTAAEVELAEVVVDRIPGVQMLRMTSSGTEATMSAIRLARAVTGREKIVKFAGAYHGHVDGLLAEAGSGLATQGIPASPGVTESAAAATLIVPWNAPDALANLDGVAAILAEPVPANMGVVPPAPGFLAALRDRASAAGALLIFDEVITGFRVSRGGAQELYGVIPDLTIMGKIVGGGLPAAAYGGRRELMERIAPAGDVYQAGTLSGNPLATAAALATLKHLDAHAYARLTQVTERLAEGLREAAASAGRHLRVQSVPGLLTPFFCPDPVQNWGAAARADQGGYGAWARALLERGVYPPASQFEAWFPSLAHTDADVERTIEAVADAFEAVGP